MVPRQAGTFPLFLLSLPLFLFLLPFLTLVDSIDSFHFSFSVYYVSVQLADHLLVSRIPLLRLLGPLVRLIRHPVPLQPIHVLRDYLSRTVPPRDSGTHHPPSGTHKLSRHYQNASRDPRDVGTPSEELTHSLCFGTQSRRGRLPVPLQYYFGRHHMLCSCPFLSAIFYLMISILYLSRLVPYETHS